MEIKKVVKIFMITIVVLFAIIYAYMLYKEYEESSEQSWPETISDCPDYWNDLGDGKCKNTHNLGTCNMRQAQPTVTFDSSFYDGEQGKMNRCRWAKNCNVSWEGIDDLCA